MNLNAHSVHRSHRIDRRRGVRERVGGDPAASWNRGDGGRARPLATLWCATLVDGNPDPDIVEVPEGRLRTRGHHGKRSRSHTTGRRPDRSCKHGRGSASSSTSRTASPEPTTVHWHGLRIPDAMDGSPMIQAPIPAGGTFTYDFLVPDAGSFWYHPHVNTHDQLERGLYGALIVQGRDDPLYDLERSLVLDDVRLDASGAIAPPSVEGLDGLTGRWGDVFLTNGAIASLDRDGAPWPGGALAPAQLRQRAPDGGPDRGEPCVSA